MFRILLLNNAIYNGFQTFEDLYALFLKYNKFLLDDYSSINSGNLKACIVDEILKNQNHFYLIIQEETNELMGFVYLDNWIGSSHRYHSCNINTCFKKKFWGKKTFLVGKQFLEKIFKDYKLIKIKAEVFENNFRVKRLLKLLGFEKEGLLKAETLVRGNKQNIEIYSLFNDKVV